MKSFVERLNLTRLSAAFLFGRGFQRTANMAWQVQGDDPRIAMQVWSGCVNEIGRNGE
jgi:hypothetical protein